jgi:DNA-binding SARP family transcriptional activator
LAASSALGVAGLADSDFARSLVIGGQLPFVLTAIEGTPLAEREQPDGALTIEERSFVRALEAEVARLNGAAGPNTEAVAALCGMLLGIADARRSLSLLQGSEKTLLALIEELLSNAVPYVATAFTSEAGSALPLTLGAGLDFDLTPELEDRRPAGVKTRLRVRLLGRFEVEVGGRMLPAWRSRRARQLFAYLLLNHRDEVSRHRLMGLFWPEHSEERAENNLSLSAMTLRRLLDAADDGAGSLIGFRAGCYYVEDAELWLDTDAFETAVENGLRLDAAGDGPAAARAFDDAIALYGGDLLPGELYEDWTLSRRRKLQDRLAEALHHRAGIARGAGDYQLSIRLNQQLLELDPALEAAHRQVILDYLQTGQRSRALQQTRACREALRRHLGAEPDAETRALFARIGG